MASELTIRKMKSTEVPLAVEWADREGWQPGLTDAGPFIEADPDGYFVGEMDGQVVSMISLVRASDSVAFIGFYIVDPFLRGTGLGKPLWDEVLGSFAGETVGADAVPEQVSTYEKEGFQVAYRNARFSAEGLSPPTDDPHVLVAATEVDFDSLVDFDARHFFGPRPGFLRLWIEGPGRDSVVSTVESGTITGFAASRMSGVGHRIGPVFAEDQAKARSMFLTLAGRAGGMVVVDVPLPNQAAVDMFESLGMARSFETSRIYRGPVPDLPLDHIFGVTSLELG